MVDGDTVRPRLPSPLIDETKPELGSNGFLHLEAEATEATLNDAGSATVKLPGDAPLKFEQAFQLRSGQTRTSIADFTPVKQGQTDRYVHLPVTD